MGLPKSVVRFKKGKVEYTSNVDACNYTINELTRAALRDVGKYVTRLCNAEGMKLKGLKKSGRVKGRNSTFQYWARKKECDLILGVKHDTWYGAAQEVGTSKIKKLGILTNTVRDNIPKIVEIESKYLTALQDEAEALALIDEKEQKGSGDE